MTVTTSSTSYLTAATLLEYHDWRVVADWAAGGNGPRPTYRALLLATDGPGKVIATALLAASGELESVAVAFGKYTPEDLNALTGSTRAYLESLVAGLALWRLACRRNPASADPKMVPGAKVAMDALQQLRIGERIFGKLETVEASLMTTAPLEIPDSAGGTLTQQYRRLFGRRAGDD